MKHAIKTGEKKFESWKATERGMWDADENMLEQIKEIYLSVEGDLEGV